MADARYTAQHVANFFLSKAENENAPISPLKLLKLVYIAYGWVLALKDLRLFEDEIQAWQHGPVIPSLYHEFKHFRSGPITEKAGLFDLDSFSYEVPEIPTDDKDILVILEHVWGVYKRFSGWSLRNKTHAPHTPWDTVYEDGCRDRPIPDNLVKDHYVHRISEYLNAAT